MKKTILAAICMTLAISLCGCSFLFSSGQSSNNHSSSGNKTKEFTVHYYDENTRKYTLSPSDTYVQCDFFAPTGKYITGLYDSNGIQYADADLKVEGRSSAGLPADLYARYDDVDISYLNFDPLIALDENPKAVDFYSSSSIKWVFDPNQYPDDQKMISACLCNPYAILNITVSFEGKGNGSNHYNEFYSKLKVCDEAVGSISKADLGDGYTKYTYTAQIKAKQLTNGNYEIVVSYGAKYGYDDYTIKNIRVNLEFDFGE